MIKIRSYISYLTAMAAIVPNIVVAQYTDLPPGNAVTFDDIGNLITTIARFLIVMSTIVAVIFIVWSGIMMMAAQSDAAAFTKAQTRLKHAVWGVVVAMGVFVIINTVAGVVDRSFFCSLGFSIPRTSIGVCFL